jgi:hypothetical protein
MGLIALEASAPQIEAAEAETVARELYGLGEPLPSLLPRLRGLRAQAIHND